MLESLSKVGFYNPKRTDDANKRRNKWKVQKEKSSYSKTKVSLTLKTAKYVMPFSSMISTDVTI